MKRYLMHDKITFKTPRFIPNDNTMLTFKWIILHIFHVYDCCTNVESMFLFVYREGDSVPIVCAFDVL